MLKHDRGCCHFVPTSLYERRHEHTSSVLLNVHMQRPYRLLGTDMNQPDTRQKSTKCVSRQPFLCFSSVSNRTRIRAPVQNQQPMELISARKTSRTQAQKPGESYRRRLWCSLLSLCDVFRALINFFVC